MRRLVLILLLASGMAGAQITMRHTAVNTDQSGTVATSISTSSGIAVSAGDALVVSCRSGGSTAANAPTDTAGDTFTLATSNTQGSVGVLSTWLAYNVTSSASETITCNYPSSLPYRTILVWDVAGAKTSGTPLDVAVSNVDGSASTSCRSASFTTAVSGEAVLMSCAADNLNVNWTPDTGYACDACTSDMAASQHQIVTGTLAASTATLTMNGSNNWIALLVTLEPAGSPPPVTMVPRHYGGTICCSR